MVCTPAISGSRWFHSCITMKLSAAAISNPMATNLKTRTTLFMSQLLRSTSATNDRVHPILEFFRQSFGPWRRSQSFRRLQLCELVIHLPQAFAQIQDSQPFAREQRVHADTRSGGQLLKADAFYLMRNEGFALLFRQLIERLFQFFHQHEAGECRFRSCFGGG